MSKVFISCAVTGSGDTAGKHPDLPKTPEQIATAAIEAAKADLKAAGVRWIVLHLYIDPNVTPALKKRLEQDLGPATLESEDHLVWILD